MAEKKKSPSTARPRAKKPAAAAPEVAAASPVVAAPVVAAPVVAAPVVAAPVVAAPIEVDARATIHVPAPPPVAVPPHDAIARRAREIHAARGGSAFDNWLQAERELAGR